jgi:Arc/MetJ family transcription regulator
VGPVRSCPNRNERVPRSRRSTDYSGPVIFKRVGDLRPYPDHGYVQKQWAAIAPHQVRLDQLVTTKRTLDLEALLEEDSTFYGDLFAHVVAWRGDLYLEDGLHRALRAALQQRQTMHARVLDLK